MRRLALALVLGSGAFLGISAAVVPNEASLVGKEAPPITTKDFLQSDGRTTVADFKGQVLLVEKFATWCGPCVGQMPHLVKLTEEYGKKGFQVISISNEPRDTVLKFLTQKNVTEINYTMGVGGGAEAYPAPGIPKGFLIGVDGTVIWEGHPGELTNDMIEAELKKVKLTDETKVAKSNAALKYAESLIAEKEVLRGVNMLASISKTYKGTEAAKQADERSIAVQKDAALAKELAAQKTLDGLVGGLELPKEKLNSKERTAKATQLESLAKKVKDDAPHAAQLAMNWQRVMNEDWKVVR